MLAIIPARGGSKGLPKKNIRSLAGKPLIAYTIEAAKQAEQVSPIIVSTDDDEIAAVAQKYGAEVPFLRPPELATDDAPAIDTFIYTIKRLREDSGQDHRECVVLQPTSPLRDARDIDNAIALFYEKQADSVIAVSELTHPPAWAKKIDAHGILRDYFDAPAGSRNRQAFEKAFMPNGAIYVLKSALLMEKYSYYSDKTYAYVMPRERSIDIDDQWDFEFAEFMMKKLCKS